MQRGDHGIGVVDRPASQADTSHLFPMIYPLQFYFLYMFDSSVSIRPQIWIQTRSENGFMIYIFSKTIEKSSYNNNNYSHLRYQFAIKHLIHDY